ncbi:Putative YbiA-like superfamily protein [Septoria linicola]|uniref:YbiA-like superfamily protein n=1 Tax=Septoria linicola TaxID=215465 RepID=A0A9Q9EGU5_9PEZI|nr:Putative YbiA-like superfamily protein [Septoria linicola]
MSWTQPDGKGPRWIGDNLPDVPKKLQYAQDLPPKVTDKYVLFFGYDRPEPECALQQWYPSPFKADGKEFHTAEQYMMYHKALLMNDEEVAEKIAQADTPAKAKQLGREVKNFKQEIWDQMCDKVVEEGSYQKFKQNEKLGKILLGTGDRQLVETSPNDRLWGIGFNSDEAEGNEDQWGENKLGKALERARERLRREAA